MSNELRAPETITCNSRQLFDLVVRSMVAVGANLDDAEYMAYQLVSSEVAGHPSHGLRRLPEYVNRVFEGKADPRARVSFEKGTGALVALNGNRTFGHFALRDAMMIAIERAGAFGISAVTVRNSDFAGRFAPFCELAAEAGMISLIFGNNNGAAQTVLPPGGKEPRLSTNPLAAGVPRSKAPHLVLDFATSTVASGRLHEEKDNGTQIPDEWVGGDGYLKTFGGFKGFGLSLLVEALGGALSGSDTVSERSSDEAQGTLIIVIDVAKLRDLEEYTAQVEEFIAYVKGAELESGARAIRAPGENTALQLELSDDQLISLSETTWKSLQQCAERIQVKAL